MAAYGAAPIEAGRVDGGVDGARGKGDSTTTWRRRAGVVVAAAAVMLGAVSCARSWRLGGRTMVRTRFAVDVGCITKDAIDAHWPEFFQHDITGAEVILRGKPPFEFGGTNRDVGNIPLTQEGFSAIYSTVMDVKLGEQYGFALVNAAGERMFELGHSRHFKHIHRPVLSEGSCVAEVKAGGAVYRNRQVPTRRSQITLNANGEYEATGTWGSCVGAKCPVTVKLIATVEGAGDNVYGIEEQKAMKEIWKKYKGHFSIVSAGVENTWGLDTVTKKLAWTRNADLNPYSDANWKYVTNANAGGSGSIVDFDAGYDDVMGVTSDDKVWQRPVSGANQWTPAGHEGSRLVQTTLGRTHVWGVNSGGNLYRSPLPMHSQSEWAGEITAVTKQVEVGDADCFVLFTDSKTLKRKQENGGGTWVTILDPANIPAAVGAIDQVAVGETSLWILSTSRKLFSCKLPCNGPSDVQPVPDAPAGIISIDAGKVPHP
ncbi:Beta-propeller repeat TECPR [Ostreococcus tauri]|uniref:Beta-propeller repeat TECPR n=1 Tax=Ostreococcus tauri TaxID=70448 RepID=A0A096P8F6_OSTTA|nr:Beta-propeller repeat TECPR [Ostreococcus tauri]CEG00184.1 Beta-propeller repeat TECPR [Ostreococcus tauri]|eukprot:XP_003082725.2 Beta-propeller repeat TECPR [Ostreococcus tauri]